MAREYQSRHQIPNHYLWIRPSISPDRIDDDVLLSFLAVKRPRHLSLRQIMALLTNRDILYRVLIYRFGVNATYRYGDLLFMTEQLPNHDSRVELSKSVTDRYSYPVARIEWRLKDADFSGFEKYTTLLFRDALRSEQYTVARRDTLASWVENFRSSAHHLGTTRMADHPRHGVVDRNLQAFGIDNLFVCDGSVFPTSGSVNPVFTILALSRRLGQFLLNGRYSSLVAAWTQGASAGVDTMPTNSPRGSTT